MNAARDHFVGRVLRSIEINLASIQRDEPEVTVLDFPASPLAIGLAVGSGHLLAAAHGLPGVAVLVSVSPLWDAIVAHTSNEAAELVAGFGESPLELLMIGVHELGHSLAFALDKRASLDEGDVRRRLLSLTAIGPVAVMDVPDAHDAAWAAATSILYRRLAAQRPDEAVRIRDIATAEFQAYGMPYDEVASIVADIPDREMIRPLAADPGFVGRIEAVVPSLEERRSIIAARQQMREADVPPAREPAAVAA